MQTRTPRQVLTGARLIQGVTQGEGESSLVCGADPSNGSIHERHCRDRASNTKGVLHPFPRPLHPLSPAQGHAPDHNQPYPAQQASHAHCDSYKIKSRNQHVATRLIRHDTKKSEHIRANTSQHVSAVPRLFPLTTSSLILTRERRLPPPHHKRARLAAQIRRQEGHLHVVCPSGVSCRLLIVYNALALPIYLLQS